MDIYIPDTTTSILHYVTVDFTKRFVETPVHLVQYDASLPILAITLMQSGNAFDLPEGSVALLKYGKNDRTFVILDPLGVSSDGSTVFFEVPYQMTVEAGSHQPIVEVWIDGKVGASSSFVIVVDRNPVQNSQIESLVDYQSLVRFKNEAAASAEASATSETNAANSAAESASSATAAANSASASAQSARESAASAEASAQSATESANSATASAISETNAAASEVRSEEILTAMQHLVENSWSYLPVNELPAEGRDTRTIYLVPSDYNYIEEWVWTIEGNWLYIGQLRENLLLDTDITISPEDWNSETREAIKSVPGVTEDNKVYAYNQGGSVVYCKSQATDQLVFGLKTANIAIPTESVSYSIQIINPVLST